MKKPKLERRVLGLVLPEEARPGMRAAIVDGAVACAEEARLEQWVMVLGEPEDGVPKIPGLEGVVGFLATGEQVGEFSRARYPVINVSNSSGVDAPGVGRMVNDDFEIGRVAAEHLWRKGYREFLVLEFGGRVFARERAEGFRRTAEAAGGRVRIFVEDYAIRVPQWEDYVRRVEELMRPAIASLPPGGAIFAVNDWIAVMAQLVLHEFFPDREATTGVMGVDNSHGWGHAGPLPGLSTVQPDYGGIGREAIRWLVANPGLDGREAAGRLRRKFPPLRVIERASTAGMACADPLTGRCARWAWENIQRGEPLTASQVASAHRISRRSLDRRFIEYLGCPVGEYLQGLRLDLARRLLRETDFSVAEVSERCGYSKQSALSRALREADGVTPRMLRESKG